jgi:hypothetical protein
MSTTTNGTMIESIARARNSLQHMHDPGTATVTVHGTCPNGDCSAMNVVEVRADTTGFTCAGCGTTYPA